MSEIEKERRLPWGNILGTPEQAISYCGPHKTKENPESKEPENESNPGRPTTAQK